MVKTYHIEYLFTGGERHLKTDNIFYFNELLFEILLREDVIQGTIKIYTEENKV